MHDLFIDSGLSPLTFFLLSIEVIILELMFGEYSINFIFYVFVLLFFMSYLLIVRTKLVFKIIELNSKKTRILFLNIVAQMHEHILLKYLRSPQCKYATKVNEQFTKRQKVEILLKQTIYYNTVQDYCRE